MPPTVLPATPKALATTALVLAAPLAIAFDGETWKTQISLGFPLSAAVSALGAPDVENCFTTIGVRFCRLEWTSGGILSATVLHRALFISDRLVAKSTLQATTCTVKE